MTLFRAIGFFALGFCCSAFAQDKELALPPSALQLHAQSPDAPEQTVTEQPAPRIWSQEAKPHLNFLELNGYFRMRGDFFQRCDLGTFIPGVGGGIGRGTSACPVPLSYYEEAAKDVAEGQTRPDLPGSLWSMNMRLRIDPTINVSEDIRIRTTIDALDNLVLGSTPRYMGGPDGASPSDPIAFLSLSQNFPMLGVNSVYGSIAMKRVWAEVSTPVGELRFGRIPFHWGLGILYNSGNGIDDDFGDNIDGILFATEVGGHYLIPSYTINFAGPTFRAGGLGSLGDNANAYWPSEGGQRVDLDPRDNIHTLSFSVANSLREEDAKLELSAGGVVFNYGVLGSYRFQIYDSQYFQLAKNTQAAQELAQKLVRRDAHAGLLSFWSSVRWDTLVVEGEFAGQFGRIGNSTGFAWDAAVADKSQPVWILQGGAILRGRYGFLRNRLQVGLESGWASGDSSPGFGVRPGIKTNPQAGDADGQQFGRCRNADCSDVDNFITNFRFHPDYKVDLLLFREVLGTVTDAVYLRPHIAYFFTENSGVRGDIVSSFTTYARSAPGNSNFLGLELDASAFYKSRDGFYLMGQFGVLFPFNALNHNPALKDSDPTTYDRYGTARTAYTLQLFAGVEF